MKKLINLLFHVLTAGHQAQVSVLFLCSYTNEFLNWFGFGFRFTRRKHDGKVGCHLGEKLVAI